jgi:hypothetical protein
MQFKSKRLIFLYETCVKIIAISYDLLHIWNITFHRTLLKGSTNSGSHFINYDTCMTVASVSNLQQQKLSENSSDYINGVSRRVIAPRQRT